MASSRSRPHPFEGGVPHFAAARWSAVALVATVLGGLPLRSLYAQDWVASAADEQNLVQRLPPAGGSLPVADNQLPAAGNQLTSYLADAPPSPGAAQESPLDRAVRELQPSEPSQESPLDRAVRELGLSAEAAGASPAPAQAGPALPRPETGGGGAAQFKLVDISLDGLFAAGTSTQRELPLQDLEGGGHDPRKRGFTVRGVELSMQGAVDPYLDGEMHMVDFIDPIEGSTVVELEEAFMTTRSLPNGLQIKAGQYLTEFGRNNPTHPHAWAWLDQPIINTRVFGPDGMRAPGARLSWLVPVDWFSQVYVGVQNANGEQMSSFLANEQFFVERPIGGRPFVYRDVRSLGDLVYTERWENSWTQCEEEVTWLLGQSAAFGPNATGMDGNTQILGLDLTRKWKPAKNERGWPFTIWTSEFMVRRYQADSYFGPNPADPQSTLSLPGATLTDYGFYTQCLYGFKPKWAAGLRYEYVWGSGASLDQDFVPVSHNDDPFRDNRHRVSPLLAWYVTEFSRFNFQYNFDFAEHLPNKNAHSFWLGAEFMLGSHPAHKF